MVVYWTYVILIIAFILILIGFTVALSQTNTSNTLDAIVPEGTELMTKAESSFPFPIFIINLDRKPERYDYVKEQLDSLGLFGYERISAVDGFQTERKDLAALGLKYEFTERRGLAGCAASHIKVWRHIAENKLDWSLILEDDAHFHPEFLQLFNEYWSQVPKDAKIIFPGYCTEEGDLPNSAVVQKAVMCTQAYMLSWRGAQYLLNNLLPVGDPVDIAIDSHFKTHPGSYIFNGNILVNGIRPNDYKESNGRRCMFNGIIYQNHEEQGSTIHQYNTVF